MLAPRPSARKHHPRRANLGSTGDSPRVFLGTVPAFFEGQSPRFLRIEKSRKFFDQIQHLPPLFLHNKVLVARLNGSPRYERFKPCSFHKKGMSRALGLSARTSALHTVADGHRGCFYPCFCVCSSV